MRRHSRLRPGRWAVSGLTVAGLLAAATTGVAHADDAQDPKNPAPVPVSITGPDHYNLSLRAEDPHPGESSFDIGLRAPGEAEPNPDGTLDPLHEGRYEITIDATGLKGAADVELPCKADGLVAVCTGDYIIAGQTFNPHWGVRLGVGDESAAGDTGSIVVTGEGAGLEFTSRTIDVLVGGPKFEERKLTEPDGFAAGDVFRARPGFRNIGGVAADGVALRFTGSRGLTFPQRFGNCSYEVVYEDDLLRMRRVAVCTFEGTFAPGDAYQVKTPVKVKAADFAYRDIFDYRFTARTGAEPAGTQGEGRKLKLEQVSPGDSGPYGRQVAVDLPMESTYDLDLTGDRAKGAEGEKVSVTVALHNYGPAWLGSLRMGGGAVDFTVQVPEGASVVSAPEACEPDEIDGKSGFWCRAGTPMLEKATREFTFEFRVDEVVEGALGRVTFPGKPRRHEVNRENNDGWIVLNGTGDEETPGDNSGSDGTGGSDGAGGSDQGSDDGSADDDTATANGGSGGDGGTDTDGGSLALTGTGAMTLGGVALALLAAGGGLLVVRRRRAAAVSATEDAAA